MSSSSSTIVSLLGEPSLKYKGKVTKLRSQQALALLGYLATSTYTMSRSELLEFLWEGASDTAKNNLRVILSRFKKQTPELLEITRHTIRFNYEQVILDTTNFEKLAHQDNPKAWLKAAALYRGEFLAGVSAKVSAQFENWLTDTRGQWRERICQVLQRIVETNLQDAAIDIDKTIQSAHRWLELDPYNETALTGLLKLYAKTNQLELVKSQFERFSKMLKAEMDLNPSQELTIFFEILIEPKPAEKALKQDTAIPNNLNSTLTGFVGRETKLLQLCELLEEQRLVTLKGLGGIGKSRLALEVAQNLSKDSRHRDGIYFVPLENVQKGHVATQMISVLGLDPVKQNTETHLLNFLKTKAMLLVLDNFEHLISEAHFIAKFLENCPKLFLLVTSRENLNLLGEQVIELEGLTLPEKDIHLEEASLYDALKLFENRACLQQSDFSLNKKTTPVVSRLCQAVEGMPLAIEILSSWLSLMNLEQLAKDFADKKLKWELLNSTSSNLLERHHSIERVFLYTWELLSLKERTSYSSLSIFQSGFNLEAARAVSGTSLADLKVFINKSLLKQEQGLLQFHPLFKQYVKIQRKSDSELDGQSQARHASHFLSTLSQKPQTNYIDQNMADIRVAWFWSIEAEAFELLEGAQHSLKDYFIVRGNPHEGLNLAMEVVKSFKDNPKAQDFLADYLDFPVWLCTRTGNVELSEQLVEEQIDLLGRHKPTSDKLWYKALNPFTKALMAFWQGNYDDAELQTIKALDLLEKNTKGDQVEKKAHVLNFFATILLCQGNYGRALNYQHVALELCQSNNLETISVDSLILLGDIYCFLENFAQANKVLQEALVLAENLGLPSAKIRALTSLSFYSGQQGELIQAIAYIERAFDLHLPTEVLEPYNIAMLQSQVARLDLLTTNYLHAQETLLGILNLKEFPKDITFAVAMDTFTIIAELYILLEDTQQATLLLMFILNHKGSIHWTRGEAQRLLAISSEQLSPEQLSTLSVKAKRLTAKQLTKIMRNQLSLSVSHLVKAVVA